MSIDPAEERRRIEAKYAAAGARDLVVWGAAAAGIVLASLIWDVDWWVVAGTCTGLVGREITKFRLRRNVRDFADRSLKR